MLDPAPLNPKLIPHSPHYAPCTNRFSTSLKPLQVSPKDLGYEIDADELVSLLFVPLPEGLLAQPAIDLDPGDFDRLYHWFLS